MRDAAEAAGRDPDAIVVSVMGPALVGVDEAAYQEKLEAAAATRDTSPAELETKWSEMGFPVGSPDRAQSTVAALEAVGVDVFYAQHLDLDDMDSMIDMFTALRD